MSSLEATMNRRETAPGVGVVHEVVMHQGRHVQQLEAGGGLQQPARFRGLSCGSHMAPVAEGGTKPFAATGVVAGSVKNRGQLGTDRVDNPLLAVEEGGDSRTHRLSEIGADRSGRVKGEHEASIGRSDGCRRVRRLDRRLIGWTRRLA